MTERFHELQGLQMPTRLNHKNPHASIHEQSSSIAEEQNNSHVSLPSHCQFEHPLATHVGQESTSFEMEMGVVGKVGDPGGISCWDGSLHADPVGLPQVCKART
jgi:hypothetical protein